MPTRRAVVKSVRYFLAHAPGLVRHGSKPLREIARQPELWERMRGHLRSYEAALAYPPNLTNICAGPFGDPPHNAILSQEDIYQVIEEGRGAMPSWSIRFLGALNDQQINDLVVYLVETSSENVPFEDNVCLNEEASARALEETELNPRDP